MVVMVAAHWPGKCVGTVPPKGCAVVYVRQTFLRGRRRRLLEVHYSQAPVLQVPPPHFGMWQLDDVVGVRKVGYDRLRLRSGRLSPHLVIDNTILSGKGLVMNCGILDLSA